MSERPSRRAFLTRLVGLGVVGLLSACGPPGSSEPAAVATAPPTRAAGAKASSQRAASGRSSNAAAGSPASPTAAVSAAAKETARIGGILTYALPREPDTLDPANALTAAAETVGRPIYDGLLALGPGLEPHPALAEKWVVSPDGLRYTLFLRKGVTFHDGTPFNAEAARYNVERLLGTSTLPGGAAQAERPRRHDLVAGIVRAARAVDELTFEVSLEQPFSPEPQQMALFGAAMVSPEAHQRWKQDLGLHPVGTGPFRFVDWVRGNRLTLERWDESWRGRALLDGIVFTVVPDEAARLRLLEAGEAQLSGTFSADSLSALPADGRTATVAAPAARALGIALNTQAAPFTDRRVRQALNYAIDRDALVSSVYQGLATPLGAPLAPMVQQAAPLPPYAFDPARAKLLLAEAGYPNGFDAPLIGTKGRFAGDVALLEEVQRQLLAVGVKTRPEQLDVTQYNTAITKAADETGLRMSLMAWLPQSGEVRSALYPLFHSSQWMPRGFNTSFFKNALFDDLIERGTRATDSRDRDRLFTRAQELLHDEAPWIFLVAPSIVVVRADQLHEPFIAASELVTVTESTWLE